MYSAYCLQNYTYFHVGRNSATKRRCMEDILEYLLEGSPELEFPTVNDIPKMSNEELETQVNAFEVEIHNHNEEITDGNKLYE